MSTLQALHSLGHHTRYFIIDEWMDLNKGIVHMSHCQEKFEQSEKMFFKNRKYTSFLSYYKMEVKLLFT